MYSGWSCWCGDALFFLRLKETLDRLAAKLEAVYNASGGKKINIISHSMGGLLVKCFMCLHSDVRLLHIAFLSIKYFEFFFSPLSPSFPICCVKGLCLVIWTFWCAIQCMFYNVMPIVAQVFEKYVKNWIAIAAPFQGKWSYAI